MIHNTTERQTNFQPNPHFRYHLGNSGQKRIGYPSLSATLGIIGLARTHDFFFGMPALTVWQALAWILEISAATGGPGCLPHLSRCGRTRMGRPRSNTG